MKVIVGSTSNRKIEVVRKVFNQYFNGHEVDIVGHNAISGVPNTPYDKQTPDGAKNRALDCNKNHKADFCVGLESGLVERYGELFEEAWAYIITKNGKEYSGYSSGLKVPDYILKRMKELNLEHCDAMTIIEKELETGIADTWATYSGGIILREVSLEEALRNALIQSLPHDKNLYFK